MSDATTRKPLTFTIQGASYPSIVVPTGEIDEVTRLLDEHGIPYEVEEDFITWDDNPEVGFVNLGRDGDASRVRAILEGPR